MNSSASPEYQGARNNRIWTSGTKVITERIRVLGNAYPGTVALSRDREFLTYADLNASADRFANYLVRIGIQPGDAVALCLERSFDWIVAALGIMRAAAAYVPLDPSWPDVRMRFVIKDSGAKGLIARSAIIGQLSTDVPGIDPARDASKIAAQSDSVSQLVMPENLAYLIYTSGSTGFPKGVEITHANLTHLAMWHNRAFVVVPGDRASHVAGLAFDASAWEVWPNLCSGATVVLAGDDVRVSPELMLQWMVRERITVGFASTAHAQSLMEMHWPDETRLRFLLTGGDVLLKGPTHGLPFQVVNNYGLTECCVVSTSGVVAPGGDQAPSIGRPVDGCSIYLLDELGNEVGAGNSGEIYIGGDGVGRGYRNLDAATEKSFLPDRFSRVRGSRMFRTGDRAVQLANGDYRFIGRLDRQVKIRGQRVELDEIGSALMRHPSVEFAVATIFATDESRLVAHVLPKRGIRPATSRELQNYLLMSLPDYMVPSAIVEMSDLPLSLNGKLDLTLLPALEGTHRTEGRKAKPTKTSIEERLLSIMRELVEDDAIGLDDNFFLAGGHSLLGMQLVVILQNEFGITLTLQQLFEAPTVEDLARVIELARNENRLATLWRNILGLQQVKGDDDFFARGGNLSSASKLCQQVRLEFDCEITIPEIQSNPTIVRQATLVTGSKESRRELPRGVLALRPFGSRNKMFWIHYLNANLAKVIGDDQPFFSVSLTEEDVKLLGNGMTLEKVASCLVKKIRATQSTGPYILGGLCVGGVLAYEIAYQLQAASETVSLLVLVDPPSQTYIGCRKSLANRWTYFLYLIKRTAWLGPRSSFLYVVERLLKQVPISWRGRFGIEPANVAQALVEDAVFSYRPRHYSGNVLLLLASERPHLNPSPDWQDVIASALHTQYIPAYHRELMSPPNAQKIADAIVAHLSSSPIETTVPQSENDSHTRVRFGDDSTVVNFALHQR
jgi:amino acid adenylation domain-containing protein